ncbi:U-box domain-containing protein 45 [Acorus gramineus]|uniref:RING-type E3 ubiquitin transferase n=1 Tax=Acorus gramineus TaxID=55184 RepID=A0AAV9B7G5_ACOGR|nr:U-box domain-containing protein 45 [Acorus gramineus]
MDVAEVEENLFAVSDAKLHAEMCRKLSGIVCKILRIFPVLEAARPRSKSGIQALCALHVALDKAKSLLQHCSDCSKLYLAITGDSILVKFEKARTALEESLRRVEDIVPQTIGCQILEIVGELEGTIFALNLSEKQVGDEVIALLQKERKFDGNSSDSGELEAFHQAASKLGITSSRAALTERRALKRLVDRARAEDDKRKEFIVAYLLQLMRKYSKLFRSEVSDDNDSQGSTPCSPTVFGSSEDGSGHGAFERQISKLSSFSFKPNGLRFSNFPVPPEEFSLHPNLLLLNVEAPLLCLTLKIYHEKSRDPTTGLEDENESGPSPALIGRRMVEWMGPGMCPISLQLMYDPVIISSGQTYERACIEKWFDDGHSTCPKTQQQLSHLCLTPNYCVKGLIASWCEQNGVPPPDGPPESLDLNYWRMALSEREMADSRSAKSVDCCKLKGVIVAPLEELGVDERPNSDNGSCLDCEVDEIESYQRLLAVLCEGRSLRRQKRVVEQIRFVLKEDEEARIFMGANGFVEALIRFLRLAIHEGDQKAQEVGAMALFNLAVNNNRNKGMLLSAGILPLLEDMILSPESYEPATALYLNLSCFDEAKPLIGSSRAVPFLVQLLRSPAPSNHQCKLDALHALYNLSTHPPNALPLLSSGILDGLHSLLLGGGPDEPVEKAIAVLINLASSKTGRREITSVPGLIGGLAMVLETGQPVEQEQAVLCLLMLCNADERCSQMVLQEGVIPALVSVSVNGTPRGMEKAQKLLMLFREQRQRDTSPPARDHRGESSGGGGPPRAREQQQQHQTEMATKTMCKSTTTKKKLGRTLSSMWKSKNFSVYQC